MSEAEAFPRGLSDRERAWLDYILPAASPGCASFRSMLEPLVVLGEGRWGRDDFILGRIGQEIDRTEGMLPVMAYGEIACTADDGAPFTITLAVHQPNDDGMIEFQVGTLGAGALPAEWSERSRWSYSHWKPGAPCPATGERVREIALDSAGELLLVISPAKRVLWLHDARTMVSTLVPVTNFYNELMLLKGVRDPKIALDHKRLFDDLASYTDADLRGAFARYNVSFRKVDATRLREEQPATARTSFVARFVEIFKGGSR
jgi:hypothetical protein